MKQPSVATGLTVSLQSWELQYYVPGSDIHVSVQSIQTLPTHPNQGRFPVPLTPHLIAVILNEGPLEWKTASGKCICRNPAIISSFPSFLESTILKKHIKRTRRQKLWEVWKLWYWFLLKMRKNHCADISVSQRNKITLALLQNLGKNINWGNWLLFLYFCLFC